MNVEYRVKRVLEENGIYFYEGDEDYSFDIDSFTFISIIVNLETEFNIEIPETYLQSLMNTLSQYVDMIENLVGDK